MTKEISVTCNNLQSTFRSHNEPFNEREYITNAL